MGKPFTSSETFTWLTEHFRTSLSQMKPDLDLMFAAGVNHVFFHGSCYTPKDDPWPGWKFYASIDMSPTNSIWRDTPFLMQYIERCQSFLQMGKPDNDFLVYLPVHDMWKQRTKELLMQFDIHAMDKHAPTFIQSILRIDSLGYDCDYISDRQLEKVTLQDNLLVTEGGTRYKGIIIPTGTTISPALKALLSRWSSLVVYGEDATAMAHLAKAEPMKSQLHLRSIRRQNDTGYHYFIANLTPNDICQDVALAVPFNSATWYDPMTGDITPALVNNGKVAISLRSGESRILRTSSVQYAEAMPQPTKQDFALAGPWSLSFIEEAPRVPQHFTLDTPQTWETLNSEAAITMGTGVYTTTFKMTKQQARQHWMIDLGDVRESARVYINGQFVGCAWAVPFILDCRNTLKKGKNELRIEVTNLPANRISDMDRRAVPWRKMKEINVVDINYKKTTYESWQPVKSGLNGEVRLFSK